MPPPLTADGEGLHKNSRKMKRLRDASCMRKRETKQDRWGRQRGGRKARWDKLDRQPSALKGRLRSMKSAPAGRGVDNEARLAAVEEAFAFVYANGVSAAAAAAADLDDINASSSDGGGGGGSDGAAAKVLDESATSFAGEEGGETIRSTEGEEDGGGDGGSSVAEGGSFSSSPERHSQKWREALSPITPTPAAAVVDGGEGAQDALPSAAAIPAAASSTKATLKTPSSSTVAPGTFRRSVGSESRNSTGGGSGGGAGGGSRSLPGGLARAVSMGGGGLGSGRYRGSPPPLHRRLSSPAGVGSSKRGQKQRNACAGGAGAARSGRGLGSAKNSAKKKSYQGSERHQRELEEEEEDAAAATPPPPPSLFESVFKDKLPSLTPKKVPPATPRLSRDSIVHAIFQSLFGKRKVRSGPRERYGGDWDDVDDDEQAEAEDREEEVDESWIKTGINLTLFNSKAVDFACRSTAGADLLHQYVDKNAVFRLVTDLRFEDPRVPSPRLMIIKAVYENCPHLRLPTLRALAHASHDHLMRTRELESWAAKAGVDIAEAAAAAVSDGIFKKDGGGDRLGPGGRVRVTGREQSQTLVQLLLFALETFPRFFMGMAPPDEAGGQQQRVMDDQGAVHGADFNGDFGGHGHGEGVVGGGEFLFPAKAGGRTDVSVSNKDGDWDGVVSCSSLVDEEGVEQQQQQQQQQRWQEPASPGLTSLATVPWDPSLDASGVAAEQGRSPSSIPNESPSNTAVIPTIFSPASDSLCHTSRKAGSENTSPSEGRMSSGACARYRGGDISTEVADGAGYFDGGGDAGLVGNGRSSLGGERKEGVVGSPGNGCPGGGADGDPVLVSDRGAPAWPSLAASSLSPAKQRQPGSGGSKQEPPWSPAWATAGVRILEESAPADFGGGADLRGVENGGGGGVWDQGMASKDLAWGASGAVAEETATGLGGGFPSGMGAGAGAARALRFMDQGEGDGSGGSGTAVVCSAARDISVQGTPYAAAAAAAAAAASNATEKQRFGQEAEPASGGLGADEWPTAAESKSNKPEKRPAMRELTEASRDAAELPIAGEEGAPEGQGAEEHEQHPTLPATPSAAAGYVVTAGGISGAPISEANLPAEALKEASRSLCNLYASHGLPAAGAEVAAVADAPEQLQPLAAAGSLLCNLWPPSSALLLRRLLGTWPAGSARREVAYLRLVAAVACSAPPLGVVCPGSRLPFMLFRRLAKCINSANTKVAQEATFLVQAEFILVVYLAPDRRLMDLVTSALCANREHWSADVRNASDQTFDLMLDYL